MILKKFKDNYDAEFVNLMLDIQNLIENYSKSDKLKINSWAKILCAPTINIEFKKNRNLYAIKLLDNVINGKLEEPFDKFAKDKELKKINPILVKTELTQLFLKYIKKYDSYENFINYQNPVYISENEIIKTNKISKKNTRNDFHKNNIKRNNSQNKKLLLDYDNKFVLVPSNHKRSKSSYNFYKFNGSKDNFEKNNNNLKNIMNERDLRPSDILLIRNFGNLPYKKYSHLMELKNNYRYNKYEIYKLNSIINSLNDQRLENNNIILCQKNEIDNLKKQISRMQLKIKKIYDSQK